MKTYLSFASFMLLVGVLFISLAPVALAQDDDPDKPFRDAEVQRERDRQAADEARQSEQQAARDQQREANDQRTRDREAQAKADAQSRADQAERDRKSEERDRQQRAYQDREDRIRSATERFNREAALREQQRQKDLAWHEQVERQKQAREQAEKESESRQNYNLPNQLQNTPPPKVPYVTGNPGYPPHSTIQIGTYLGALNDIRGDVNKINAAQGLMRELQFNTDRNNQSTQRVFNVLNELERVRRQNGGLNPQQWQQFNELQNERIQLLAEHNEIIALFQRYGPNL